MRFLSLSSIIFVKVFLIRVGFRISDGFTNGNSFCGSQRMVQVHPHIQLSTCGLNVCVFTCSLSGVLHSLYMFTSSFLVVRYPVCFLFTGDTVGEWNFRNVTRMMYRFVKEL